MRSTDPTSATSPDEPPDQAATVRLVCDPDSYTFYVEVDPGHSAAELEQVCAEAERRGLIAFDFDEADPDEFEAVLDGATVRIWLRPTCPSFVAHNPL